MISRRTASAIATAYMERFSSAAYGTSRETVHSDDLYDFFYERAYEAWFCNAVRRPSYQRPLKDWFLKIHTGETFADETKTWSWKQREQLGQEYLKNIGKDFIKYVETADDWDKREYRDYANSIRSNLELDGYIYRDGELRRDEADVLSVEDETGVLHDLYKKLGLGRRDEAFAFLSLCEEHYVASRWPDCIGNARKFLELALAETCRSFAIRIGRTVDEKQLERPVEVRSFLEKEGLLEHRERETLDKVYGLLSHTGGHPYMAEKDQARLLRQLSLTVGQFVLLRLDGFVTHGAKPGAA